MKKKKIKVAIKIKLMYHAMKAKEISIMMIFSLILILKNIVIFIKKDTKRKTNKLSKKRCFNKFATFCQKRKNNIN